MDVSLLATSLHQTSKNSGTTYIFVMQTFRDSARFECYRISTRDYARWPTSGSLSTRVLPIASDRGGQVLIGCSIMIFLCHNNHILHKTKKLLRNKMLIRLKTCVFGKRKLIYLRTSWHPWTHTVSPLALLSITKTRWYCLFTHTILAN